jgi:hypothetical protein
MIIMVIGEVTTAELAELQDGKLSQAAAGLGESTRMSECGNSFSVVLFNFVSSWPHCQSVTVTAFESSTKVPKWQNHWQTGCQWIQKVDDWPSDGNGTELV